MPYKLLSSLLSARNVDLERFALASTVEERRAFVDERFTAGTADHFLLSVLCDQQAGVPYAEQREKLSDWVRMRTKGGRNERRPNMGPGFRMLDGRARLQALLADPSDANPKTTPEDRDEAIAWLRRELDLSFSHAPPKG